MGKSKNAFLIALMATLFLGNPRIESTTYTWQYRNQGLDNNERYQTLLDPPFGLPNHKMSGDVNHFYNWSDVGYVFGFYGHPYHGDTVVFTGDGQSEIYYREGALGPKFQPDLIKFGSSAQKYNFTIMDNHSFVGANTGWTDWIWTNKEGWGVKNESSHVQQIHVVNEAELIFKGKSSALASDSANAVVYNIGNWDNSAGLVFQDSASAGGAPINVKNGSYLHFKDESSAGKAAIALEAGSNLKFSGQSSAADSTITLSESELGFSDKAVVANASIQAENQSTVQFFGNTSAGHSNLVLQDASQVKFSGKASAAESNVALYNSDIHFTDEATAGNAKINVLDGSRANFSGNSSADQAVIAVKNGSTINFAENSSFGASAISLEGSTLTCDHDMMFKSIKADAGSQLKVSGKFTVGAGEISAGISDHKARAIVLKEGSGTMTLKGNNSYSGGTILSEGVLQVSKDSNLGHSSGNIAMHNGSTLEWTDNAHSKRTIGLEGNAAVNTGTSTVTLAGKIDGNGRLEKQGAGKLVLNGENSYAGGTLVSEGVLEGDTRSLQGKLENNATVYFNQLAVGAFRGELSGKGNTIKTGRGTLEFASDSSNHKGTAYVQEGKLSLNNRLGGNAIVQSAGIISGTGELLGNLHVKDGATVSPGNSIGVLQVKGNYVHSNAIFHAQVNGEGKSSLLNVGGTAVVEGNSVVHVTSVDGLYNTKQTHQIIHADGGVQGQFAGVMVVNAPRIVPTLTYDANNVYVDFIKTFPVKPENPNQGGVIDSLDQGGTNHEIVAKLMDDISKLSDSEAQLALDQLTAQQYTNILYSAELSSQKFIRRLYNPLRSIVTEFPYGCYDDSCCYKNGGESWIEAGQQRSFIKRNGDVRGFNSNGYEITFGHQKRLNRRWTIGNAVSYEYDIVRYKIGGKNKVNTFYGALYGLYRPQGYYFLADLACGYSIQKVKRPIEVGTTSYIARSKPKVFSSTLYMELGTDFCCQCQFLLIQPFVGLDLSYFRRSSIHEHGASAFNMSVAKRSYTTLHSRLGAHLTTNRIQGFIIGLDLAWQYRLVGRGNHLTERFTDFGGSFAVSGLPIRKNSFDGALNISMPIRQNCELFAELVGQKWQRATSYSAFAGIKISW